MRVERSTVDQVKARFESAKRKKAEAEDAGFWISPARVAAAAEDEERLRAERFWERKKAKKEAKRGQQGVTTVWGKWTRRWRR